MEAFIWLGGVSAVVAFILALAWARNVSRLAALLLVGLLLAVGFFVLSFLSASTDPNHRPNRSDCSYVWGRWWEPPLLVAIVALNLIGWTLGAAIGAGIRRVAR